MRCKRCGELLEPGDTRCPVCGKSVAARKKAPSQKPSETSIKLPQLEKFTHAYGQDVSRSRMLQLVTIAAVAVVMVLAVLVYVGVGELQSAVTQLEVTSNTLLQSQHNQNMQTPDSTGDPAEPETDPPENPTQLPTEPEPLPLSQQDLEAELTLYRAAEGTYAAASMDLGDYEDQAVAWVHTVREGTTRQTDVAWILEQSDDRLDLNLTDSFGGEEAQFFVSLTWDLDGGTFSDLSNAVCFWEYRVTGGEWQSLPVDYVTAIPGGCEVRLSAEELGLLLGQYLSLEMRCSVSMTHDDGGAMRIVAGGIALNAEGLVSSGDLLD